MTTTISFLTKDCIVMGCDSLATAMKPIITIENLMNFFDANLELLCDDDGKPLINSEELFKVAEQYPYNQIPSVTKIFNLKPANAGVLTAGIASIGDKSIKNIIDEFLDIEENKNYLSGNYTIVGIGNKLLEFIGKYYNETFVSDYSKPYLEMLLSGYSKKHREPEAYRLKFHKENKIETEVERKNYNILFGGQYDVIQRVVFGIDLTGWGVVTKRASDLNKEYYKLLKNHFEKEKIKIDLPAPEKFEENLKFYTDGLSFSGFKTDLENFSDQAAIDFVDFLINIMIKSQEFSNSLPTVGGDVHIAVITKSNGFKWISKEEYKYKNYGVPKHE